MPLDPGTYFMAAALFWVGLNPFLVVLSSFIPGIALSLREKSTLQPTEAAREPFPLEAVLLILGAAALCLFALFVLNRTLFELSLLMLRIDLFAFGGGLASVPLMLHEVVEIRHWMDPKTFMDGIALGQVTPGPIVITATFVGYSVQGFWGALVATASILPVADFAALMFRVNIVWVVLGAAIAALLLRL
jgi:chromate transporter